MKIRSRSPRGGKQPHDPDVARHLLEEIGMDPNIVDESLLDESTHEEIKDDHQRVIDAGGYGVPTLFFGDHPLYGPVLIDPLKGESDALMGHSCLMAEFPDLYEMQKLKSVQDQGRIADTFRPYLEARDWVSINRGKSLTLMGHQKTHEMNLHE